MAQTSAVLVLEPIFEADLQAEQYAYRPGRSAHDAVTRLQNPMSAVGRRRPRGGFCIFSPFLATDYAGDANV